MGNSYYVSPDGNYNNPGTLAQPFKTIQQAANIMQPGDTAYIRGGVYREKVIPKNSGLANAPITFKAYNGEDVTISGARVVTPGANGVGQWQPHDLTNGKSIYKVQLSSDWNLGSGQNQVFVNGAMMTEARWPNVPDPVKAERKDNAISTGGSLDADLGGGNYKGTYQHPQVESFWKGGRINFASGAEWSETVGSVTDATNGKVSFDFWSYPNGFGIGPGTPTGDDPFFLSGKLEALDTQNEWFFDQDGSYGAANTLYLWAPNGKPSDQTIELKAERSILDLNDRAHIKIEDINLRGGHVWTNQASDSLVFDGITSEYGSHQLLGANVPAITLDGKNHKLINSEISKTTGGSGVLAKGDNHLIQGNIIHDTRAQGAIEVSGTGTQILQNTVFNTPSHGISFAGLKAGKVNYNHVYNAGTLVTDIAGINAWGGGDGQGTEVAYNQVHDIKPYYAPTTGHNGGYGIRLDSGGTSDGNSNYKIHHNLVWDVSSPQGISVAALGPGMPNFGDTGISVENNTVDGEIYVWTPAVGWSNSGTEVKNNIALGAISGGDGALFENNIDSKTNPQLVDPANNNFLLKSSSPAINAAKVTPGINDQVVDGKPDIGALEYGQSAFVAGVPSSSSTSSPSVEPVSSVPSPTPVGPVSSPTPVVEPVSSPTPVAGPVSSVPSPTPVVEPVSSPTPVVGPVSSPTPVVEPVSSGSTPVGPVSSPTPVVEPVSSPTPVVGPVSSPTPVVEPVSSPTPVVEPVSSGSSPTPVVGPVSSPTPVVEPVSSGSTPVGPVSSVPTPVVGPVSSPTPVVEPVSSPTPVVEPVSSVPSPVVGPVSSVPTPVVGPVSSPTPVVEPVSSPSPVVEPVSSPTPVVEPVSSVPTPVGPVSSVPTPVVGPVSSPSPVVEPVSSPTPVVEPVSSVPTPVVEPVSSPTPVVEPVSSVPTPVGPVSSPTAVVGPVSSPTPVVEPVSSVPTPVVGPVSSPTPVVEPVSSGSSPTPVVGPVSSPTPVVEPVSSVPTPVVGPVSSPTPVVEPVSSPTPVVEPVSSVPTPVGPVSSPTPVVGPVSSGSSNRWDCDRLLSGGRGRHSHLTDDTSDVLRVNHHGRHAFRQGEDRLLSGGRRPHILTGSSGTDTFDLSNHRGPELIRNFEVGEDQIALPNRVSLGQLSFTQQGNHTLIMDNRQHQLLASLKGIEASTLTSEASNTFVG